MHNLLDVHMHDMHFQHMKLADYLATMGLTDEAFASQVGISQSQVSRLKRGLSRPSWDSLVAIERATGGAVAAADFMPPLTPEAAE